jgi:DHA3 family tetracycline resistance protein-like MFS transporter
VPAPRFLAPFSIADFRLLWAASFVSRFGDGIYLVAIAWQTYAISNVPTALSLVGLAATVPSLAFVLFGGALADRFPRRRLMVIANVIQGLIVAAIGSLSLSGLLTLALLIPLVVVYSAADALFQPSSRSILPQIVPVELRPQANGLLRLSGNLTVRLLGPALGGLFIAAVSTGGAFLIDGATFFVSLTLLSLLSVRPATPASAASETFGVVRASSIVNDLKEGLRFVLEQRWILASMLSGAVGLLCYEGPKTVLLPYLVKNHFHGTAGDLGLVLATGGVGAVVTSFSISQFGLPARRQTQVRIMYGLWTLLILCIGGYALAGAIWQLMVVAFVAMVCMIGGDIIWTTLLQDMVPDRLLGRVVGLDQGVSFSLVPVSMVVSGALAQSFGTRPLMLAAGLSGGLFVALVFLANPMLHRFPQRLDVGREAPERVSPATTGLLAGRAMATMDGHAGE